MKPEEYKSLLDRLERLERRDRRMRLERLAMLAAIVWLAATGPASRLLVKAAPRLQAGEMGAQSVAARSLTALRHLLRVQPVLNSATVIEDEREAFDHAAPAPRPAPPVAAAVLASRQAPAAPQSAANAGLKSCAPVTTSLASKAASQAARAKTTSGQGSGQTRASLSRRAPTTKPTAASAASLAAEGLSIGQDVQRRLTSLPADGSSQTLALAEWPDLASVASQPGSGSADATAGPVAILPEGLNRATSPASASPGDVPAPAPAVPQIPVALKALGYAQAADGSAQIVLSNGNALFVVNEGQEFLDRFRVVALRPEGVDVEDRLTNRTLYLTFGN